jgi:hypothetical protein
MKITMIEETYTAISDATPYVYRTEYDAHKEKTISFWVGLITLWVVFWVAYYLGSIHWLF